jgi:hypothetical protein
VSIFKKDIKKKTGMQISSFLVDISFGGNGTFIWVFFKYHGGFFVNQGKTGV